LDFFFWKKNPEKFRKFSGKIPNYYAMPTDWNLRMYLYRREKLGIWKGVIAFCGELIPRKIGNALMLLMQWRIGVHMANLQLCC